MSSLREDFVDSLCQEAVREMADNFFCPRRDLDRENELFAIRARAVARKGKTALLRAGRLHAMLLYGRAAPDFYRSIGADPGRLIDLADVDAALVRATPVSVHPSRRTFANMLAGAYAALADALDEYVNGKLYPDPERPGRKVQSMHYRRLAQWCGEINERIDEVNRQQGASRVLCYFKGLDPGRAERERVTGGGVDDFAKGVDASMRLPQCGLAAFELPELPELPAPDAVEDAVVDFAKNLYEANKDVLPGIIGRLGGVENE